MFSIKGFGSRQQRQDTLRSSDGLPDIGLFRPFLPPRVATSLVALPSTEQAGRKNKRRQKRAQKGKKKG